MHDEYGVVIFALNQILRHESRSVPIMVQQLLENENFTFLDLYYDWNSYII